MNVRLAREVQKMSPGGKLMLQDLHHLFNAAIIITLHQIVFCHLRTYDTDDVAFALHVFQTEKETGSNYGDDCWRILKDLRLLVWELRDVLYGDKQQDLLPGQEKIMASRMHINNSVHEASDPSRLGPETRPYTGYGSERSFVHAYAPSRENGVRPGTRPANGDVAQRIDAWMTETDMELYRRGGCMIDA